MDFGFTEEQEKLRKEVHDFYLNELPEDHVWHITPLNKELQAFWLAIQKKAGARGYLTPGWGKESGGLVALDDSHALVEHASHDPFPGAQGFFQLQGGAGRSGDHQYLLGAVVLEEIE